MQCVVFFHLGLVLYFSVMVNNKYDRKHVPMSLIRDEDCRYRIIGILFVVSSLSFCYHRLLLVLCVFSTVCYAFLCPLLCPHHFLVAGLVCHTCLSVYTFLCKFITIEHRVLNRAASQQISVKQKQSAASERQSRHDDVRRPGVKATTNWFRSRRSEERRECSRNYFGGNMGQHWMADFGRAMNERS